MVLLYFSGEGEAPHVSKETPDDESAILDSGDVKKAKSKGIKAPKALKSIVGGGKSKEKKEKKEKQRQHQRELMSKFTSDQDATEDTEEKEKSEEWKKYQELLGKSEQDVQESKEKLSKMEAGFKPEIDKLWGITTSSSSGSPWAEDATDSVNPIDAPLDETNPPKVGWVGFDDDFHEKGSPDQAKSLTSQEEGSDLFGQNASQSKAFAQQQADADLLGLGEQEASESQPGTTPMATADVSEFEALTMSDNVDSNDTTAKSSVGIELVDDFLGLTSENSQPKPIKDPLDMLKSDHQDTNAAVTSDLDDFLGISNKSIEDSLSPAEKNDDDFGLGSSPKKSVEVTVTLNGDLFDVDADINTAAVDPFTVDLEKITKESEASVKDEPELNLEDNTDGVDKVQSPVSDDFDPRADISSEDIQAKPVTDAAPQVKEYCKLQSFAFCKTMSAHISFLKHSPQRAHTSTKGYMI